MKTILIEQIQMYSQISGNTEKRLYEPAIKLAEVTDLAPFIGAAMLTEIGELTQDGADLLELRAFHLAFIVPFLAKSVELRLLITHGNNWAREGIVQFQDSQNTSAPVGDAARANLLKQCRSDKAVFQTMMQNRLKAVNQTFDGVFYAVSEDLNQPEANASTVKPIKPSVKTQIKKFM